MSPSSGQTLRNALAQLARVLGLAFACVVAGVFAGPWTASQPLPTAEQQVVPVPARDVPCIEERHENCPSPPSEETEDDEETIVAHLLTHPPHPPRTRDAGRDHDAVGPPTRALDVETPPPRQ